MTDENVAALCEILGLDVEKYEGQFSVKSSRLEDNNLRIGHYLDTASKLADPKVAAVRGVIFDKFLNMLVAATNYRSTVSWADFLQAENGEISLATEFGQRRLKLDLIEVNPFEEGYAIRIFRWGGKTYFASNKSIGIQGTPVFDESGRRVFPNAGASRWGHNIPFVAQLNALLKVSEDDYDNTDAFFPVGCNYSPYVYVFYVTHVSRLQDTLMEVNDFGFVNFIGAFQSWSYDDSNLPLTAEMIGVKHETPTRFENTYSRIPPSAAVEPFILAERTSLTLEEVNNVLRYGVTDPTPEIIEETEVARKIDPRLTSGESVRIRYWNEKSGVAEFFHVQSAAFRARHERHTTSYIFEGREIRQNLANQYKCAVTDLVELSQLKMSEPAARADFVRQIIPVIPADPKETVEMLMEGQIITSADIYTDAELAGLTRSKLEECIAYCRMLMANPAHQLEEYLYLRRFREDWDLLLKWLIEHKDAHHYKVKSDPRYAERDQKVFDNVVVWILKEARSRTYAKWPGYLRWFKEKEREKPYKQRRRAEKSDFHNEQIRRILINRNGRDIYALIRLARHDTHTDSKSIADPTAAIIPMTNFPALKTKSKKPAKSSRPSSPASSSSSRPVAAPSVPVPSSSTTNSPAVDLSQFF